MNIWILLSLVLSLISPIFYTKSMLEGKAKPHRVTRAVIWLAAVTGIIGILGSSNLSGIMFAGIFFVRASYLLVMSIIYGEGGTSKLDKVCFSMGVVAVISYVLTGSGLLAVMLGVLADLIAFIPTFVKTWKKPESEDPNFFAIEVVASICAIIAIDELRVDTIFPIYFVLSGGFVLLLIYRKKLLAMIA
ncbi:hypothetical protein KBD87_00055 [Candidatus Saccharibacteria bacterium]|nr:hypothetical protein [Candidatus Saccharibacteria bacterium]